MKTETEPTRDRRVHEILDVMVELSHGQLGARATPSGLGDELDEIITGLNTLAEEWQASTVSKECLILAQAVDAISDGVAIAGLDGVITFVNGALERMLGYGPGELVGKHVFSVQNEQADGANAQEIFGAVLAGGWVGESSLKRKNGKVWSVRQSISLIRDGEGRPIAMVGVTTDISEQRAREEELQGLLRQNEAILDSTIHALVCVRGPCAQVVRANRTFYQNFGLNKWDVDGRCLAEVLSVEGLHDLVSNVLASPEDWDERQEVCVPGSKTNGKWFLASATLLKDYEAEVLLSLEDITEKRRAEQELRASEQRMRSVLQASNDAFVVAGKEGRVVLFNASAEEMFGWPSEDILGQSIDLLMPEGYRGPHPRAMETYIEAGEATAMGRSVEREGLHRDGAIFPIEVSLGSYDGPGGPFFVAAIRDITQRKQAEEALRLRSCELEALYKIASILGEAGDFDQKACRVLSEVAQVANADWVTLRKPDEHEQGLRLVAVAGPGALEAPPVPLLLTEKSLSFQAFCKGESAVVNNYPAHPGASLAIVAQGMKSMVQMPVKAGGKTLGLVSVASREDDHFSPETVALLTAITDGMGVLLENARLYEEITLKNELERRRDTFVSIASHELRTPITSIMGFSELLLTRDRPEPVRREWLESINEDSQRLTAIVDDLLNVSLIHSGELTANLAHLRLQEVVEQVMGVISLTTNTHELVANISPDMPRVVADRDKLTQVLTNLLNNAVTYSPKGGRITISARHEPQQERVVVSVADRGIGVAPEDRDHLFTPFYRVQQPETEGVRGSGLGLYIVKGLVELMQGEIWLESQLGQGSTFFFSLPTKHFEQTQQSL